VSRITEVFQICVSLIENRRKEMDGLTIATVKMAREGDPGAIAVLDSVAEAPDGSKDAGPILDQLVRENIAATGEKNYVAAFMRVAAANPKLHKIYLNSNGVKW